MSAATGTAATLAAAETLVRIIATGFEGVAKHLTFTECEALATLCAACDQPDAACGLMLEWATRDSDAEFYAAELAPWGIEPTPGKGADWEITGAAL